MITMPHRNVLIAAKIAFLKSYAISTKEKQVVPEAIQLKEGDL